MEKKTYKAIMPEITLQYKKGEFKKFKVTEPEQVYEFMSELVKDKQFICECAYALYLNRANNTIGWQMISQGGLNQTVIDVRYVAKTALDCGASAVIIGHNHPSGEVVPSNQDVQITNRLKDALQLFTISLLDHIIIGDECFYSFADEGRL